MEKTVSITVKSVYGNEMIYPANDAANHFCELTGKKTFSHRDLQLIEKLGYFIEQVAKPISYKAA
jgi:hypothetical protein